MYSIKIQKIRFERLSTFSLKYLQTPNSDRRQFYIYSSGVLNAIWQSWNYFWRTFWLTHLIGGRDLNNNQVDSYFILTENEALRLLLIHFKKNCPHIIKSYNEPSWGSVETILKVTGALKSRDLPERLNNLAAKVEGLFGVLGDSPKHLQKVRNAAIHLARDNIKEVKLDVLPFYRLTKFLHPVEIIFSNEIITEKVAIVKWTEELNAFFHYL